MKYLFFAVVLALVFYFFPKSPEGKYYGETFDHQLAIPFEAIDLKTIDDKGKIVTVTASVNEVCKKKGCWMVLEHPGEDVRTTFKNYGFFMPLDLTGEVTVTGVLKSEMMDGNMVKHFKEDSNDPTAADVDTTISYPVYSFIANGVFISK